ncbi:unnamed protein product, partial [Rotaria magnacalcarata]
VEGQARQTVRLAAQLLSVHVGKGLIKLIPRYEAQGNFIVGLDAAFNLLNSVKEFDSIESKNAFKGTPSQMKDLDFLNNNFKNARFVDIITNLNQDILENFFGEIRGMCNDSHPDSSQFIQRIRFKLLGIDPNIAIGKTNLKQDGSATSSISETDSNQFYINAINSGF